MSHTGFIPIYYYKKTTKDRLKYLTLNKDMKDSINIWENATNVARRIIK